MRSSYRLLGAGVVAGLAGFATVMIVVAMPATAGANCSVFDRHPCAPTVCSVFRRGPCIPEIDYPSGQDLRLTIESAPAEASPRPEGANQHADPDHREAENREPDGAHKLDSIKELFAALRACWVPPAGHDTRPGMQMSVRLSFTRNGDIIGTPRVTYTTPDTPDNVRDRYLAAITEALQRCTPLPFTRGMGGAVAGRPIAIRFVDNRKRT